MPKHLALVIAFAVACALTPVVSAMDQTPSPEGAKVYFIEPKDGAEISGPVTIKFGLSGMGVAPAGIEKEKTGHHHLLINTKLESYEDAIPADDQHRHFGGGQTQATLDLPKGTHTLQLVLGDQNHIPHKPVVESEVITITVK